MWWILIHAAASLPFVENLKCKGEEKGDRKKRARTGIPRMTVSISVPLCTVLASRMLSGKSVCRLLLLSQPAFAKQHVWLIWGCIVDYRLESLIFRIYLPVWLMYKDNIKRAKHCLVFAFGFNVVGLIKYVNIFFLFLSVISCGSLHPGEW